MKKTVLIFMGMFTAQMTFAKDLFNGVYKEVVCTCKRDKNDPKSFCYDEQNVASLLYLSTIKNEKMGGLVVTSAERVNGIEEKMWSLVKPGGSILNGFKIRKSDHVQYTIKKTSEHDIEIEIFNKALPKQGIFKFNLVVPDSSQRQSRDDEPKDLVEIIDSQISTESIEVTRFKTWTQAGAAVGPEPTIREAIRTMDGFFMKKSSSNALVISRLVDYQFGSTKPNTQFFTFNYELATCSLKSSK